MSYIKEYYDVVFNYKCGGTAVLALKSLKLLEKIREVKLNCGDGEEYSI